jgi:hypothetical protein
MKHHLILFYGASSGAGKSTLSSRLHQVLKQANVPTQWLYEDDVQHLDLFAPVMAYMRGEGYTDMPSACLATTANLVKSCAGATADVDPPDGDRDLTITLRDHELWANLYWPTGCRLAAVDEQRFQLQATSHWLVFVDPVNVTDPHLHYHYCGKIYTYQKMVVAKD